MNLIALVVSGFLGTLLRFGMGEWIPAVSTVFPLGTAIINLSGCLFLGWFITFTNSHWNIRPEIRLGVGTGFIGSFTTYSAFSVESVNLIQNGHANIAIYYILISIFGGVAFTFLGVGIAQLKTKNLTARDTR